MQIPDGDGALALHVMPRYMLHNNLQAGVQYKQQVRPLFGHLLVCQVLHLTSHAQLTLLCIQPFILCAFSQLSTRSYVHRVRNALRKLLRSQLHLQIACIDL